MSNNLLLEIGTEEIPAKFLNDGLALFKNKAREILLSDRIPFSDIKVYGTSRRMILMVTDISLTQESVTTEIRGPSKNIAFDPSGKITDAGIRFAAKCGVKPGKLLIKNYKNNDYIFAVKNLKGQKTVKILPEVLPRIIKSLSFPKQMHWEESNFRFVRPIRWITALLNDKIIKFSLASVISSRFSFGHRLKGNKAVSIPDALSYKNIIENNMVMINTSERENSIIKQLKSLSQDLNANIINDYELLEHVVNLVEYPQAISGNFEESYLELPVNVLITVMKEQQKYFALEDENKNLLPKFIFVSNNFNESHDIIRQGNEWVFKARLNDAKFFWNEDRKTPLEGRCKDLENIVFQNKLGSMADKAERIKKLSFMISEMINLNLSKETLGKASNLCKIDLLTEMVKEFPTLQGIMGKEYILAEKGDPEIAEAVFEHYLPRFSNDKLPLTDLGTVLAIADKMDNITSFFLLGKIPTGSEDPFALRRQANGILQIVWNKNFSLSFPGLFKNSISLLKDKISVSNIEFELNKFFIQRFRNLLLEEDIKYDCIDAVLAGGFDNPLLDKIRAKTMMDIYSESDFKEIATSFSRVTNILKNVSPSLIIKQELLTENAEKELYQFFLTVKENFTGQIDKNEYHSAYNQLKPLRNPIDRFFNDVLVMDKNKEIQQNRLNLLYNIASMFNKIADFSKIVI